MNFKVPPKRIDSCIEGFYKYIYGLHTAAKKDLNERILVIIFAASHCFVKDGFRTLCANKYDVKTNFYELIPVELCVRSYLQHLPNVCTVVHYATHSPEVFNPEIHKHAVSVFKIPDV